MNKRLIFFLFCTIIGSLGLYAKARLEYTLDKGWLFTHADKCEFAQRNYNDADWQSVRVPHDWAIFGPFNISNDKQHVAISQDGQKEAMEHAGRTGGLPFVGVGWYRYHLNIPIPNNKKVFLIFDGAMSNAQVFINGKITESWPYGYNSFFIDITSYLDQNPNNVIAVRLENETESSRWYPGAGLYRNVHLLLTPQSHIPIWGTQLTTPFVSREYAKVVLKTKWLNSKNCDKSKLRIVTNIFDPNNQIVASAQNNLCVTDSTVFEQSLFVKQPLLWDTDSPNLYVASSEVYENGCLIDNYSTRFGIRCIEVVPEKGLFLNGNKIKFKGVCNHHDLGPLGTAVNEAAIRRQIRIMKDMGANAIRTSHNMPAPELVKICDEMGMMIMAESFDEWKTAKVKNGYHKWFNKWVKKDLTNLIHQFRNNPSVVMWCIGNEVPDQFNNEEGAKLSRMLQDICHQEDPSRYVTQGMDAANVVVDNNIAAIMDVAGFNYRSNKYGDFFKKLPQQIILGTETASTVSSRGVYKFPVRRGSMVTYDDHQSSSYDVEHCSWSNLPEDDWLWHDDYNWCIGEFIWTGFDYLGEPTPYYANWPSHSSMFGVVDLCGLPKDRFYLYRSHWNTKDETLHILPHWNWEGREGQITPIFVYTNYPSAELFINGKSQGFRFKDTTVTFENSKDSLSMSNFKRQKRYRLMWMNTVYEPGVVEVFAYDENHKVVAHKELHTAGVPHHIELIPDRQIIQADGKDLSFITVKVVDKDGNLCPNANNLIKVRVKGVGSYRAGANGNPISLASFQKPQMNVFNGMMTFIIQSTEVSGDIQILASSPKLKTANLSIKTIY